MGVLGAAMQEFLQSSWGKYLVALAAVAAALLFRGLLDPWIGNDSATGRLYAAVARCSPDLRYLWVNRLYSEWVGQRKPEEMIDRPMFEVLGLDALEQIRPYIDQVLTGKRVEYERFARRPLLGRRRWIHVILE